jgi:tetratricopeptide (TPR) repeat protein
MISFLRAQSSKTPANVISRTYGVTDPGRKAIAVPGGHPATAREDTETAKESRKAGSPSSLPAFLSGPLFGSVGDCAPFVRERWGWLLLAAILTPTLLSAEPKPAPETAPTATACPSPKDTVRSLSLLSEERLERAEAILLPHEQTCIGEPGFLLAMGQVRFMQGRYGESREVLDQALLLQPEREVAGHIRHYRALAARTKALTEGHVEVRDPEGRFVLLHPPGKDAVLAPYVRESFPAIIERIGAALSYRPDRPVRIEVYAEPADLARASSLTEEEIEDSGTIALCKYHKLMLVSPRALVRGYSWLDTLSHEYVHFVISRLTGTKVPIWLHEAYAKYLESRWRSEKSAPMRPSSQHLLRRALKTGDLVTFEEMSPSMAKLPSQERTALAFAEVYTVARYLDDKVGIEGMRRLLDLMEQGRSDRKALEEVLGTSFRRFYARWKRYVKGQRWRSVPAGVLELLVFKDREDPREELRRIGEKEAEDFTYLGDLLKARGRVKASVSEYKKAEKRTKRVNPIVQYKLADALLKAGDPEAAYQAVQGPLKHYPEHVLLQLNRGKAALRTKRVEEAREALELALRLNPFDVEMHTLLAEAAARLGDRATRDREREALRLLKAGGSQ